MQIELNPEQINELVIAAVRDSLIGGQIQKQIQSCLSDYKFREALESAMRGVAIEVVREMTEQNAELRARIRAAIAEKLTDQTVNDFTERMIARIARDY